MATTENTYTGNGSTVLYSFTFPYLETTDIKVSLNGTNTTAYTLANPTTVQFNSAPANGAAIRIYRQTDDAALSAQFYPGSAIRSQDLNTNFTQALYIAQETQTFASSTDASAIQGQVTLAVNTSTAANSTANTALSTAQAAEATANGIAATANSALAASNAALPKAGGLMTGTLVFAVGQPTATTSSPNIVQLTDSISSTSTNTAATPNSVKTSYDLAAAALPKVGGTMSGAITFASGQTYPQVPQNSKTSAYTLVAADAGKHVSITTGGVTIPSGVFSVGDAISIFNNSGSSQTITQGASTTLRFAGTSLTGNRALGQYGLCSVLCVASNVFVITGSGLT